MWNFTTTNIINANHYLGDTPAFILNKKGEDGSLETSLVIKKGPKFLVDTILRATKAKGHTSRKASAKVEMSALAGNAGIYRLKCYIADSYDNNPLFANSGKYKGRPFYIEVKVAASDSAAEIAKKFVKNGKLYMNNMMGDAFVDLSVEGTKLVLAASNEYLNFQHLTLQVWNDANCLACNVDDVYEDIETSAVVTKSILGLGTYEQIMKDLILPTEPHRSMYPIWKDELPAAGHMYDEYVITMLTDRPEARGLGAVGAQTKSVTTHVFFVDQSVSDDFKAAIEALGVTVEIAKTQADANGDGSEDEGDVEYTISASGEHASVAAPAKSVAGAKIKAVATIDSGYKVTKMEAKVASEVIATSAKGNLAFIMPAADVSIVVTTEAV